MSEPTRPPDISQHEWLTYLEPLTQRALVFRLDAVRRIGADGWLRGLPYLVPLLEADDPYVFVLRGEPMIAELRADVLVALEELIRLEDEPTPIGPTKVRQPMAMRDAIAQADAALAGLPESERAALAARVDAAMSGLQLRSADEERGLRAYRALQLLGRIDYRLESVDPSTFLTPLQEEIIAGQTRSPRPTPHLRVARLGRPAETLGWVYRRASDGVWRIDFSDARDAQEVAEWVRRVLVEMRPNAVPRVARDAQGQPRHAPDGSLVLDGVVPLDAPDPLEILRSVQAFVAHEAHAEIAE